MSKKREHKNLFIKSLILLVMGSIFFSCILRAKKCPLPQCEIRKMHRHLLIFSDKPKEKKNIFKFLKKKKKATDSTDVGELNDSTAASEPKKKRFGKKEKNDSTAHKPMYVEVDGQVLDEEGNPYIDEKTKKKIEAKKAKDEKKANKKKKKEDKKRLKEQEKMKKDSTFFEKEEVVQEEEEEEEEESSEELTAEEYKSKRLKEFENTKDTATTMKPYNERKLQRQLKKEDKARKKKQKKEDRIARNHRKGQADFTRIYRSRVTRWWRRDQNPKTGKYFRQKKGKVYKY